MHCENSVAEAGRVLNKRGDVSTGRSSVPPSLRIYLTDPPKHVLDFYQKYIILTLSGLKYTPFSLDVSHSPRVTQNYALFKLMG